jgi:hypothetical protein
MSNNDKNTLYDSLFDFLVDNDNKPVSIIEFTDFIKSNTDINIEKVEEVFYGITNEYDNIYEIYRFTDKGTPIPCLIMADKDFDKVVKSYYETGDYIMNKVNFNHDKVNYNSDNYVKFVEKYRKYMSNTPFLRPHKEYVNLLIEEKNTEFLEKYLFDNPNCLVKKDSNDLFPVEYALRTGDKFIINIVENHTNRMLLTREIEMNEKIKKNYKSLLVYTTLITTFIGYVCGMYTMTHI